MGSKPQSRSQSAGMAYGYYPLESQLFVWLADHAPAVLEMCTDFPCGLFLEKAKICHSNIHRILLRTAVRRDLSFLFPDTASAWDSIFLVYLGSCFCRVHDRRYFSENQEKKNIKHISPLSAYAVDKGGVSLPRKIPIFYSALLLTGVNLLLRLVGTTFQVYISGRIGPAGVGLLQLVMSVGSLAMVAGMAGIRTAAMYVTAEELGRRKPQTVIWVLSGCFLYSICFSGCIGSALYFFAPQIARHWIGDPRTVEALRLFAAFLPTTCLCGVMTGYFTAANRIGTLAAVEIAEQLFSMAITMLALTLWAGADPGRACQSVILGSCLGACLTLLCLICLRLREHSDTGSRIPVRNRILQAAVPLAMADVVKSGINTTENLMVPKRLSKNATVKEPLAAFGMVTGMVFPVLMFPACILFGLAELLIPELARCAAAGSRQRISYLVKRSLKVAMLYGFLFSGLMYLLAEPLCLKIYDSAEAGQYLKYYALLVPMLYCDAITDAMTKGLGQQKACVRYNILTSAMDVILLYLLLPEYGMDGYFISFVVTHLINFGLSLRRLLKIAGESIPFYVPALSLAAAIAAVWGASQIAGTAGQIFSYAALLGSLLYLFRVIGREDFLWLKGLIRYKTSSAPCDAVVGTPQ